MDIFVHILSGSSSFDVVRRKIGKMLHPRAFILKVERMQLNFLVVIR